MNIQKARGEFTQLIGRCGCSRAGIFLTEKEVTDVGLGTVQVPSCTPHKCFPVLVKALYPKGGFNKTAHLLRTTLSRMERQIKAEVS